MGRELKNKDGFNSMMFRRFIFILVGLAILSCAWVNQPKDVVTILYTSDSHGNLYPCDCKKEEDGGMSRRLTLIKEIKQENPNTILIEGGSFFAGGPFDESKANDELDKIRSDYYLKCIDLMNYDCLAIGEDEFVFGEDFLKTEINQTKAPFVATNISETFINPYIIKQAAGVNVAIFSICPKPEETGFKFFEYRQALQQYLDKLKESQEVDVIVLLTRFDEETNKKILQEFDQIDLILAAFDYTRPRTFKKVGKSIIVYPTFEGRRLTRIDLFLKDKEVKNFKVRSFRLSDKVKNDFEVAKIIPRCFSDKDCRKSGLIGHCENPGTNFAKCVYTEPLDLTVTVIRPKKCFTCQTAKTLEDLKPFFGGDFKIRYIDEDSAEARQLIKLFGIKMLPAYLASKDVEKSVIYDKLKVSLILKENKYLISPSIIGASYFIGRRRMAGRLDVFVLSHGQNAFHVFSLAKQLSQNLGDKFDTHFIVFQNEEGEFLSPLGEPEVEEDLRLACIKKYYPEEFWDYCLARVQNISSDYWDDTAQFLGIDVDKIKKLAQGKEGKRLLEENIKLAQELDIGTEGTFLLNNQEIFGMTPETKISEIEKVVNQEEVR